jgi:hypothetical protein
MSVPVLRAWTQARKLPPTSRGRRAVQGVQRGKPRSGSKSLWDRPASKVSRDRQPAYGPSELWFTHKERDWAWPNLLGFGWLSLQVGKGRYLKHHY